MQIEVFPESGGGRIEPRRGPVVLLGLAAFVPVFNERNTVVEVLRRMRAVELPDGIERGACALYAFVGTKRRLAMAYSPAASPRQRQ